MDVFKKTFKVTRYTTNRSTRTGLCCPLLQRFRNSNFFASWSLSLCAARPVSYTFASLSGGFCGVFFRFINRCRVIDFSLNFQRWYFGSLAEVFVQAGGASSGVQSPFFFLRKVALYPFVSSALAYQRFSLRQPPSANKRFHTDRAQVLLFKRCSFLASGVFQTFSRFRARRVKRGVSPL